MISLKSYFSREPEAETSYRRIIALFLQGISLHAVEGEKAEFDQFREEMERCSAALLPETPTSELLVVVGGALRAMEDYNQRTSKFVRRQSTELQHIVSMLTEALIAVGSSSEQSVNSLQNIEKSIESTQAVEDIQILKLRLKECLEAVHEEAQRQKQDGQSALLRCSGNWTAPASEWAFSPSRLRWTRLPDCPAKKKPYGPSVPRFSHRLISSWW